MTKDGVKVGGGILGGSGAILIIFSFVTAEVSEVKATINKKDVEVRRYVDQRHENVLTEIRYLRDGQKEIKNLIQTLDKRVYELRQGD